MIKPRFTGFTKSSERVQLTSIIRIFRHIDFKEKIWCFSREFMSQLLKTAFDPNRGFFKLTTDQYLYPNPNVEQIEPNYIPHYYFIGRILGKALYENMLVELPLTSFFLSKLLGQKSVNVSIDHLSSLDPELYKNLLYLKVCL